jgi:hypothetical protein
VPPEAPPGPSGPDALFVLTALKLGTADDGLDLDCVHAPAGCRTDACRDGPEDGADGVDNVLGPLALKLTKVSGTDLQAEMSQAVREGRHPLLLRVVAPTGLSDGTAEGVEVSFGLDADGDPSDLSSGRGRVRHDSEAPPGRPARFAPVAIRQGVVVAGPVDGWMPLFWTRGQIAAVVVESAVIRFRIAAAPTGTPPLGGAIADGMLAGALVPDDLSRAILDLDARTAKVLRPLGPVVRALVRRQADLDLIPPGRTATPCEGSDACRAGQTCRGGRCVEPGERADAISFAIRFEALSAEDAAAGQ